MRSIVRVAWLGALLGPLGAASRPADAGCITTRDAPALAGRVDGLADALVRELRRLPPGAADRCAELGLETASVAAFGHLICHARGIGHTNGNGGPDAGCVRSVDAALEARFTAAARRVTCPAVAAAVEDTIGHFAQDVAVLLGVDRPVLLARCAALKLQATAKLVRRRLACEGGAARRGSPAGPTCAGTGLRGLERRFERAEERPTPEPVFLPRASTTSSSTVAVSTTSTTFAVCPPGFPVDCAGQGFPDQCCPESASVCCGVGCCPAPLVCPEAGSNVCRCPPDHPVGCGAGLCCVAGATCCPGVGCCPPGFSICPPAGSTECSAPDAAAAGRRPVARRAP